MDAQVKTLKITAVGFLGLGFLLSCSPMAIAAPTNWIGPGSDFNAAANWDAGGPAGSTVAFNTALPTALSVTNSLAMNGMYFNPGAAAYTITNLTGVGMQITYAIINNSGKTQTFINHGDLQFVLSGASTDVVILNNGPNATLDYEISSMGSAMVINDSLLTYHLGGSGGNATMLSGFFGFQAVRAIGHRPMRSSRTPRPPLTSLQWQPRRAAASVFQG